MADSGQFADASHGSRNGAKPFVSVLFERRSDAADVEDLDAPDYLADLNLDQVLATITRGRDAYRLDPFFFALLRDDAAVRYRQDALGDLEAPRLRESILGFASAMAEVRDRLGYIEQLRHPLQQQAWLISAAQRYCSGVRELDAELSESEISSRALEGLRSFVSDYAGGDRFGALAADMEQVEHALAEVRYAVRITGAKVTVTRSAGEPDFASQVQGTFARFQQGQAGSHLVRLRALAQMDHIEGQILDRVAWLHPDAFGLLAGVCDRHRDFLDETILRFDREVQFYLGYLEVVDRLRQAELPFCYPRVTVDADQVAAEATFDLALALQLVGEDARVVGNDFHLDAPERVFVVTGPNNGGKTTFARTFGQLHHLAGLGLMVPGSGARLALPDRIYTHFERREDIETLRGKFEDELVRVHEILARATSRSVIVMNESFNSTTLDDALYVGTEVMERILELGPLGVYVTFVDEIASLSESTVSMVAEIVAENPAERTFKLVRRPADGLAYAWAIAEKYGLTYERLRERIGS